MTHGSLFSGIGGFDLGFERAGIETVWQVEIDPYCRKVLEKHWPYVQRFADVREVGEHNLARVDVITGGFPCQDISDAGKRAGINGKRSGLWAEYAHLVGQLRPRYIVVENVAALLARGIERVVGDLAALGYDAEWRVISARDAGLPHRRERVFIVAYPTGVRQSSDDKCILLLAEPCRESSYGNQWSVAPSRVQRVADGIPDVVDRLGSCGNAIVPQIAEWIGRRILEAEKVNP